MRAFFEDGKIAFETVSGKSLAFKGTNVLFPEIPRFGDYKTGIKVISPTEKEGTVTHFFKNGAALVQQEFLTAGGAKKPRNSFQFLLPTETTTLSNGFGRTDALRIWLYGLAQKLKPGMLCGGLCDDDRDNSSSPEKLSENYDLYFVKASEYRALKQELLNRLENRDFRKSIEHIPDEDLNRIVEHLKK